MGELAALGPAGGAGGVDEGGRIARLQRGHAGLDFGVGHVGAQFGQFLDDATAAVGRLDLVDAAQRGRLGGDGLHGGRVCRVLDDEIDRGGVLEDPPDLLGGGRLVDRDGDAARCPDREVDEGPLVPGGRHQCHPVALLDAEGDETLGDRGDLSRELGGRDVGPASADLALVHDQRRVGHGVGEHRVDRGRVLRDRERLWRAELGHENLRH